LRPTLWAGRLDTVIAHAQVPAWPGHELCAIAVQDGPDCAYVPANDGWPVV
jgi:hypothetical protein